MRKKNYFFIGAVFFIGIALGNFFNLGNSAKASNSDMIQLEKTFGVEFLINSGEVLDLRI